MFTDMRERVTIEQQNDTDDDGGGQEAEWVVLAIVWARVTPDRGKEIPQADQIQDSQQYKVMIRWRGDIDTTMRVVWGNKKMNIRSISNFDEHRSYLTLLCEEGVAL